MIHIMTIILRLGRKEPRRNIAKGRQKDGALRSPLSGYEGKGFEKADAWKCGNWRHARCDKAIMTHLSCCNCVRYLRYI